MAGDADPDGIEHVVVLMLENRSFDHLLGLLDHPSPDFPRIVAGSDQFANPSDPTRPHSPRVAASADAEFVLPVEPPHSHASVMEQLDVRFGRPRMDGFVAAYRRRVLDPSRDQPVIHWTRLAIVGAVLIAGVSGALAWGAQRSFFRTWIALWLLGGLVAAGVWRKRRVLPALPWGTLAAVGLVATFAAAGIAASLGRQADAWWGFGALVVTFLVVAGAKFVLGRRRTVTPPAPPPGTEPGAPIMRCMDPAREFPALAALATNFAVCTNWHCSVPGATWPNRNFVHAGTSDGTVDIEIGFYEDDTIFDRLTAHGRTWHVYHDGIAQLIAFRRLWDDERITHWYCFDEFARHVANGQLPSYSFIEPCHGGPRSNSQHPGNNDADSAPTEPGALTDFQRGEDLVVSIYQALLANRAVFDKTVLVITYDEHGGLYDHVPPPRARSPQPLHKVQQRSLWVRIVSIFREQPSSRFRFHRYGPRVPAVIVSPRVDAVVDPTRYDHTSIPATLRALFAPRADPLSMREQHANTFVHLLNDRARTDLPDLEGFRPQPASPAAAPAAAPATGSAPRQPQGDFALQLDALAVHLDAHLPPGPTSPRTAVVPGRRLAAGDVANAGGHERTDRVAARFVQHASARRARNGATRPTNGQTNARPSGPTNGGPS